MIRPGRRRRLFDSRGRRGGWTRRWQRLRDVLEDRLRGPSLRGRGLRLLGALAGGALLLGALGLVAFRTEILRARYELADLVAREAALREERAALRVEVRRLRDPERLSRLAQERGFGPPERVVEIPPTSKEGP